MSVTGSNAQSWSKIATARRTLGLSASSVCCRARYSGIESATTRATFLISCVDIVVSFMGRFPLFLPNWFFGRRRCDIFSTAGDYLVQLLDRILMEWSIGLALIVRGARRDVACAIKQARRAFHSHALAHAL